MLGDAVLVGLEIVSIQIFVCGGDDLEGGEGVVRGIGEGGKEGEIPLRSKSMRSKIHPLKFSRYCRGDSHFLLLLVVVVMVMVMVVVVVVVVVIGKFMRQNIFPLL